MTIPWSQGRQTAVLSVLLAGLVVASPLVTLAFGASAQPHPPVQGAARLFVADDSDPRSSSGPISRRSGGLLQIVIRNDRISAARASQAIDVYTLSTRPEARVGARREKLQEYRLRQLARIHRTDRTSIWPATAPPREDRRFIKDAFIAFIGATRGARARLPGTSVDTAYLLAQSGRILEFVDYRVEKPPSRSTDPTFERESKTVTVSVHADENETETETETVTFRTPDGETITRTVSVTASDNETETETETVTVIVDGQRSRFTYQLTNQTVTRTVALGRKQWSKQTTPQTSPRVARQLQYTDASVAGSGKTRLLLTATINVTITETRRIYDYNPKTDEWSLDRTVTRPLTDHVVVRDDRQAVVIPTGSVTIRQRVIQRPQADQPKAVVLTITGPTELTRRQLWSWAALTANQTLTNVWGIYAVRQYHEGFQTSNQHPQARQVPFPPTLVLRLTARQQRPTVLLTGKEFTPAVARVVPEQWKHRQVLGARAAKFSDSRVNLSTAVPNETTQLVIRNSPARLQSVTDVFRNPVSVDTTHHPYRQSSLTFTRLESDGEDTATRIRVRLTSLSGEPLPNRGLVLDGAVRNRVTTNTQGEAIIKTERSAVTVRFEGDPWTDPHSVYYSPSHVTIITSNVGQILPAVVDILENWRLLVIPTILGLVMMIWRLTGVRW